MTQVCWPFMAPCPAGDSLFPSAAILGSGHSPATEAQGAWLLPIIMCPDICHFLPFPLSKASSFAIQPLYKRSPLTPADVPLGNEKEGEAQRTLSALSSCPVWSREKPASLPQHGEPAPACCRGEHLGFWFPLKATSNLKVELSLVCVSLQTGQTGNGARAKSLSPHRFGPLSPCGLCSLCPVSG